jgi:hypothetical protein
MDITFQITVFLSGSFVGLIVKEFFDQWKRKQEYSRDLNKIIFSRKLDSAEKAISYLRSYQARVIAIKNSLETAIKLGSQGEEVSELLKIMNQHTQVIRTHLKNRF